MNVLHTLCRLVAVAVLLAASTVASAQTPPTEGAAVWPYLAGMPKDQRLAVMEREAKREGGLTIYAAIGIDRGQILSKIFNERYPDVKVNFVRLTEPDLADKMQLEE